MAYVNFYKGLASAYVAETHQGGIYQCTDTGDTYVFGVLNKCSEEIADNQKDLTIISPSDPLYFNPNDTEENLSSLTLEAFDAASIYNKGNLLIVNDTNPEGTFGDIHRYYVPVYCELDASLGIRLNWISYLNNSEVWFRTLRINDSDGSTEFSQIRLNVDTSDFATSEQLTQGLAGKANAEHTHVAGDVSGLANVATSGSYNDLSNKPSIPTVPSGVDDAVAEYNRNTGHNTTTSLSNVATTKRLVIATISSNQSFTTANSPGDGKELHIIVKNTSSSDRTVSMPTTSTYVNMSGDSLTVPANGYAEINVVFDNSYRYIRFAAQS